MGRKQKDTVDYFPFVIKDGKTLFVMKRKYGLAGIGFFTQIMRMLGQTPGHYYVYVDEFAKDRLNDYCGLSESDTRAMLADMAKTGKIDRDLWETRDVIYSQAFVDELEELYRKRKTAAPTREIVIEETEELEEVKTPGKRGFPLETSADKTEDSSQYVNSFHNPNEEMEKVKTPGKRGFPPESADFRQHSIGEDSIGEDSIGEDSIIASAKAPAPSNGLSALKDELANQYQQAFTAETPAGAWASVGRERKAINNIAQWTRRLSDATGIDPFDLAPEILEKFNKLRRTERASFWKTASFTPSSLAESNRWNAVVEALKREHAEPMEVIF